MNLPHRPPPPAQPSRWYSVKNTHGTDAPANGVGLVTGVDDDGFLLVSRPDDDSISPDMLVVFDAAGAAAGGYGQATDQFPWYAAADGGAVGDEIGTAADSWTLSEDNKGFRVWRDEDDGIALVKPVVFVPGKLPDGDDCPEDATSNTTGGTASFQGTVCQLVDGVEVPCVVTTTITFPVGFEVGVCVTTDCPEGGG